MEGTIEKRFDVPVEFRWYEVIVEHDPTSRSHKIFVDSQMIRDHQEAISDAILDDFSIGAREGPRKNMELDIERNRQNVYEYKLKVDGVPLEDYIREHSKRYKAFEVSIGTGARSKLIFDKESQIQDSDGEKNGAFYFRGRLIGTPKPEFDGCDVVWNLIDGNFSFQLRGVVDSRGVQTFKLFVNGVEVEPFQKNNDLNDHKNLRRTSLSKLEVFHQKGEGEHSCNNIALGEGNQRKNLKVTIDTDDDGEYMFILSIDGLPLGDYITEYKNRYTTWTVEKLGSKSKLTLDEEKDVFYFKRQEIPTKKTQPSFEECVWEGKFKEEYKFRVVKTLRGMGQFATTLFVNGAENRLKFIPRKG
ncbi:hypothetical protein CAEBREN_18248 [Caenorhabditis brenneri]|uniref:Uncharacterized protein n=1 Tax=Caenorhabditis brenneri TaxID=135651 RepID=G0MWQ3_CAEBE|nr:hypothetical protein CAEBREN_18248 [Caenorhabditis brenneri]